MTQEDCQIAENNGINTSFDRGFLARTIDTSVFTAAQQTSERSPYRKLHANITDQVANNCYNAQQFARYIGYELNIMISINYEYAPVSGMSSIDRTKSILKK